MKNSHKIRISAAFLTLIILTAACGKTAEETLKAALRSDPAVVQAILDEEEVAGDITIYCYTNNNAMLNKAKMYFGRKFPNTTVTIQKFEPTRQTKTSAEGVIRTLDADDAQERTDYLTRLSTEILSGGGADILQADIFPYHKYADSG